MASLELVAAAAELRVVSPPDGGFVSGTPGVVRALLQTDIPIDHVNRLGRTALLEAVVLGDGGPAHRQIVRLLVDAGADTAIAVRDGVTALEHARARGYELSVIEPLSREVRVPACFGGKPRQSPTQRSADMAKDLTDVLRDQLQQAVREFAQNLADGSEKERPGRRFPGLKGAVVGAGLALAAKKGIDAARQNPALVEGVSSRISAKLEELQGREEEPDDEVEEEPEPEAEGEPEPEAEDEPEKEPSAEAEEEAEAEAEPASEADEESEPEAKPKPVPKRKPRSTPGRRSAKPKAGSRAKKPASTSTRRSSKSS